MSLQYVTDCEVHRVLSFNAQFGILPFYIQKPNLVPNGLKQQI